MTSAETKQPSVNRNLWVLRRSFALIAHPHHRALGNPLTQTWVPSSTQNRSSPTGASNTSHFTMGLVNTLSPLISMSVKPNPQKQSGPTPSPCVIATRSSICSQKYNFNQLLLKVSRNSANVQLPSNFTFLPSSDKDSVGWNHHF